MGLSRRQFTQEFKLIAGRQLEQGVTTAEIARGLQMSPNMLYRWHRLHENGGRPADRQSRFRANDEDVRP